MASASGYLVIPYLITSHLRPPVKDSLMSYSLAYNSRVYEGAFVDSILIDDYYIDIDTCIYVIDLANKTTDYNSHTSKIHRMYQSTALLNSL